MQLDGTQQWDTGAMSDFEGLYPGETVAFGAQVVGGRSLTKFLFDGFTQTEADFLAWQVGLENREPKRPNWGLEIEYD